MDKSSVSTTTAPRAARSPSIRDKAIELCPFTSAMPPREPCFTIAFVSCLSEVTVLKDYSTLMKGQSIVKFKGFVYADPVATVGNTLQKDVGYKDDLSFTSGHLLS